MKQTAVKDLAYYKANAEEDYLAVPISVLRYISQLEQEQDKNKYSDEKEFYKYMAKQDSWKSVGLIIQEFIQLKLKEQDKNKYSEEDLREAFRQGQDNMDYSEIYGWDSKLTEQEWFEKFKKKQSWVL
jgi:hypothetical protein